MPRERLSLGKGNDCVGVGCGLQPLPCEFLGAPSIGRTQGRREPAARTLGVPSVSAPAHPIALSLGGAANQVITRSVTLLLRSGEIGQVPGDMF